MSRIGQKPIDIPAAVKVSVEDIRVSVSGKLGDLTMALPAGITVTLTGPRLSVSRIDDSRRSKSYQGLARSLIVNMIEGVATGYSKQLEVQGVGFKAAVSGQKLTLSLGFSSPVVYEVPDGVKVEVQDGTAIKVSGRDKEKVGSTAARIRKFFPAEPYKGKGVQYKGEHVRRKVGKTVA